MKKFKKINLCITAGAMAFLLCVLAVMPVFGMTPIEPYGAVPHFSLYPAGGSSPLAVKSLDVTWQIDSLPPDSDYRDATQYASFLEYQPRVRATYVFENPTDQPIKQGLYMPATLPPEYAEWESVSVASRLLEQYSITLDGKPVTPTVRYAYLSEAQNRYDHIVYENDYTMQALLADMIDKLDGEQLPADTLVTVYSFVPGNEVRENGGSEMLDCNVHFQEGDPLVFIPHMWGHEVKKDVLSGTSYVPMGGYVSYGDVINVYVIGDGEVEIGEWKVGRIRGEHDMIYQGKTQTTLGEIAMQHYDPNWGITQKDWYGAVLNMLQHNRIEQSCVVTDASTNGWNVLESLQPLLYYEIELAPGATAENTVQMLAYPGQWPSGSSKITLGTWCFVPVVQGTFTSVENIELHIHTPLYMGDINYYHTHKTDDYQRIEQGYVMQIDPETPIVRFTLSNKSNLNTASLTLAGVLEFMRFIITIILYALPFAAIGGLIALLVLLHERRTSGKRKGKPAFSTDQATEQETEKGAQS